MTVSSPYIVRKKLTAESLWKNARPLLSRLDMELTERCNNNCIHCYINQPQEDPKCQKREMTTSRVKAIVDEAAALGCMSIRLTGGEPLLRTDFHEIYRHIRQRGIKINLLTNGTLITEKECALLQKYPPGEPVEITLYGMTATRYEQISRIPGSFRAAITGVMLLARYHIPMLLKTVRFSGRDDDIDAFLEFAKTYSSNGRSGGIAMNFNLRARGEKEKNKRIDSLRTSPEETVALLQRYNSSFQKDQKAFAARFMHPGGNTLFSCGCGKNGSIDAYGTLQPCLLMRDPALTYDLDHGTIREALTNHFPHVLKREAQNIAYLERCAKCFLKGLCDQCPAWSYMETGTLDTPVEYLCSIAHQKARTLGLLGPEEEAWKIQDWQERLDKFSVSKDPAAS